MSEINDGKAIEPSSQVQPPDPLFAMSPEDARETVIESTFEWAATNFIAGAEIWNRAVAYTKANEATRSQPSTPTGGGIKLPVRFVLTEAIMVDADGYAIADIGNAACGDIRERSGRD